MPHAEQLLYASEKSSRRRFSVKTLFLIFFLILMGKHQCEILKKAYLEEDLWTADSQLTL